MADSTKFLVLNISFIFNLSLKLLANSKRLLKICRKIKRLNSANILQNLTAYLIL